MTDPDEVPHIVGVDGEGDAVRCETISAIQRLAGQVTAVKVDPDTDHPTPIKIRRLDDCWGVTEYLLDDDDEYLTDEIEQREVSTLAQALDDLLWHRPSSLEFVGVTPDEAIDIVNSDELYEHVSSTYARGDELKINGIHCHVERRRFVPEDPDDLLQATAGHGEA